MTNPGCVSPCKKASIFKKSTFPLFAFNGFLPQNSSTFRTNCPFGGVLLDPYFVKLGRRDRRMTKLAWYFLFYTIPTPMYFDETNHLLMERLKI